MDDILLSIQARRQEMKWGVGLVKKSAKCGRFFCKKSGKCGVVKKWTFPQSRVHYVQYQYFYFTFYLFGGAYAPNAPLPTGLRSFIS